MKASNPAHAVAAWLLDAAEVQAADLDAGVVSRAAAYCEGTSMHQRFYVASRTRHGALWQTLRDHSAVPILSTWIDEAGEGQTTDFGELWQRIANEVAASDAVILYATADDFPLKGALVEVGIAIACDLPVYAILPDVDLDGRTRRPVGSWLAHPRVRLIQGVDLRDAIRTIVDGDPA